MTLLDVTAPVAPAVTPQPAPTAPAAILQARDLTKSYPLGETTVEALDLRRDLLLGAHAAALRGAGAGRSAGRGRTPAGRPTFGPGADDLIPFRKVAAPSA